MKNIKKIAIILVLAAISLSFMGCPPKGPIEPERTEHVETFLKQTRYGFYQAGIPKFRFENKDNQIYYSTDLNTFRFLNNDASKYFELKFKGTPVEGKYVEAEINNKMLINGVLPGTTKFYIYEAEGNKYWAWSEEREQGILFCWESAE